MFAVSTQSLSLSPHEMIFVNHHIYKLHQIHPFWIHEMKKNSEIHLSLDIWSALFLSYGLHRFSPLSDLKRFSVDYFSSSQIQKSFQPSPTEIDKIFLSFSNLGIKKIENLKRFSRTAIQRRFGKAWGNLWHGITQPEEAPWIWEPHRKQAPLEWNFEFDDFCNQIELVLSEISKGLSHLSMNHSSLQISHLKIDFLLSQASTDPFQIHLDLFHQPLLKKELNWILVVIKERMSHFSFPYPLWKIKLQVYPATTQKSVQLSLFCQPSQQISWQALALKLKAQGIEAFEPIAGTSHLPEKSWIKKTPENQHKKIKFHDIERPLFQGEPQKISKPNGRMHFHERLSWIDHMGIAHYRDYFFARQPLQWIWVFQNEDHHWFQQGVLE